MGLRIVELEPDRTEGLSAHGWRTLVREQLARAEAAIAAGRPDTFGEVFAGLDEWSDAHRAYQARRSLTELALGMGDARPGVWAAFFAEAAAGLVRALERDPREPVLLNLLGVLLYELTELGGAKALFEAARRLDPSLPHVERNLRNVRHARVERARAALPKGVVVRARSLGARAKRIAAAARPASELRLSLCMIVKDEEEMLPGCLEAAAPHVDEIVVVDTGSTDRSVEIARSFGATVVSFPWNGSFADARNVSLEHATGDWVLQLDADEHLVGEDAAGLRDLLGRTWREAFYLVETNYTGGDESGAAVTHLALRVWRNRPEYRFTGRIHEQKTDEMPTYLPERFEATQIRLLHYGYLKSRIQARDKARRNIELLEQQAREGASAFTAFNLGSEFLALGEAARARAHFDAAWDAVRTEESWTAIGYAPLLASRVVKARREAGDVAGARRAIEQGLAAFPDHTDLVFEAALCAHAEGRADEAARLATRCLEMGDAPARYSATVGCGTYLALGLLAELETAAGRRESAVELHRRSLAEHPDYIAPALPLAMLLLADGADPDEVAAELPVERPSVLLMLATACHETGNAAAAVGWFGRVLDAQPANGAARIGLVEALLAERRYAEAAAEAACEPADSPLALVALVERLFAHAAAGDAERLAAVLDEARARPLQAHELELYSAWHAALTGAPLPPAISPEAAAAALTAIGALLRVQEFDAFATLLQIYERAAIPPRRRREQLAQLYLRRGYLDSAADEWIATAEDGIDLDALLGLAQVALAKNLPEDAHTFASEALSLDPQCGPAQRLRDAAAARMEDSRSERGDR